MGLLSDTWDFVGGAGQGVYSAGKGMVTGVVDLARGGYALATVPAARQAFVDNTQAIAASVGDYAGRAWEDPAIVLTDARNIAGSAYTAFDDFRRTASPEDWGNAFGQIGFEVVSTLIPATKLGRVTRVADAVDDVADSTRMMDAALDAARAADRVFPDDAPIAIRHCDPISGNRLRLADDGEVLFDDVPISEASTTAKGIFGETMADSWARAQGWERVNGPITQLGDSLERGIDGIYRNPTPPPGFIVAETKYGTSQLSTLADGTRQMSDRWIEDRLEDALSPELFDQILLEGYDKALLRVDRFGNVVPSSLN